MRNDNFKHFLHLHFLVLIAGITAILGRKISIDAIALVWYRMLIAGVLMFCFIKMMRISIKASLKVISKFLIAGIIIALHWVTFFEAINQSNISITLAMFSSGAFFASFIEPIFFKRKIKSAEILLGIIVILGMFLITSGELKYINGIILGITSAFFSSLFAVINGRFIQQHNAAKISFYEFVSGVIFLSVFVLVKNNGIEPDFFCLSNQDWIYIFILATICTTYAFIASVHVMKYISPYTVVLSYNLEPVYGIALALYFFPEEEQMTYQFYLGTLVIFGVIVTDVILKRKAKNLQNYQ